jgi:hypothetical protein
MNNYTRSYPYKRPLHYTKHSTHYHINIKWLAILLVPFILFGFWKLATFDKCPTYYGYSCSIIK